MQRSKKLTCRLYFCISKYPCLQLCVWMPCSLYFPSAVAALLNLRVMIIRTVVRIMIFVIRPTGAITITGMRLRSCFAHHNTLVSALEALRNALYKCSTYLLTYLLVLLHDTALCTVALVLRSVVMLRCAPRYSCSVEDLLWCSSVRATVELCVRKRVTADQVRTAGLVQECTATRKYVCLTRSLLVTSRTLRVTEMITVGLLQIKNFLIVKLTIING